MSDDATVDAPWPRCPQCDAERPTQCPICDTTGTDFPPADPEFFVVPGLADLAQSTGTACGPHGCSPGQCGGSEASPPGEEELPSEADPEPPPGSLICPTCDEPFFPSYPRRCEWCGHEFEDGFDPDDHPMIEPISVRAIVVTFGLLVLGLGVLAYFILLV